tara:strand:+ start:17568 stop:18320 length:753 start_codon:yes stop_codon:yes gene_type:complete
VSINISYEDHIAIISLELVEDCFDLDSLGELIQHSSTVSMDVEDIYVVIIHSLNSSFAIGWSPEILDKTSDDQVAIGAAFKAIAEIKQPTIAVMSGSVLSAGLELSLSCDIRIASRNSLFAFPETKMGYVPLAGATQRLPRAIGRSNALRMLLTGEEIDADEALRIGLVSELVDDEQLNLRSREIAEIIASRGPIATRFAKEAILRGSEVGLSEGLQTELDLTVILQSTEDRAEGVAAFMEKRDPVFKNR